MPFSNIRMIVMDVDDTLLNNNLTISQENKDAIAEAKALGITIVMASGRPTPAMVAAANELKLNEGGFVISYNGAYVTDWANQQVLFDTCLVNEEINQIFDIAESYGVNKHTYIDGRILTDAANPYSEKEAVITGMPLEVVDNLRDLIPAKVPKILLLAEPDTISRMREELTESLNGQFMISISKPIFLEFTNNQVDKSRGIDVLCNKLGISKQQVMAIGDSYNDYTMLQDCGLGIAMGNAPDDIKQMADRVTKSCDESGVAYIINQLLTAR